MKLIFCIKKLAGISGGAEWVLTSIVNGLAKRGHDVHIISFDKVCETNFYEISKQVTQHKVGNLGEGVVIKLRQFVKMRNKAVSLKPDIVFGFLPSVFVAASFLFFLSKYKFVSCEHISREWYKGHILRYAFVCLAGYISYRITFLSYEIADSFNLIPSRKKIVIGNPVRRIERVANVMGELKRKYTILNVGRLVEFKDQKTLIYAFSQIVNSHPNWHLKIIGQGPLKSAIEEQIIALNLTDKVELKDLTQNIENEYANADLFVVSSIYEGYGLVTAEASSAGLPCLGFADCEGTNKIIVDGVNGCLVKTKGDRASSLASALNDLLGDRKKLRQMGKRGTKRPTAFELDYVLDRWEETIKIVTKS